MEKENEKEEEKEGIKIGEKMLDEVTQIKKEKQVEKEEEKQVEKEEEREEEKEKEREEEEAMQEKNNVKKSFKEEENNLGYILGPIAGAIVIVISITIYCKRKNEKIKEDSKDKKIIISNSGIVNRINIYNNMPTSEMRRISSENNLQTENSKENSETNNRENILTINKAQNKTMEEKIQDLKNEGYKIIMMDDDKNSIILRIISDDQIIRCGVICKVDKIFNLIINKIYEDFPQYKKYEPLLLSGGKRITPYESLEENEIKEDVAIILNIINA